MLTRRRFLQSSALLAMPGLSIAAPTPVILDTDIGDDIDDTWALLMLLRMGELRVELAVTDFGNAIYRGRLLAKLLATTGNAHIPIGLGLEQTDEPGRQSEWLGDCQLEDYPGEVIEDGVQAIIDTIHASPVPITLLCLGPVPNIAEALRRDPTIANNARFVGMFGAIRAGYPGEEGPAAEWNVRVNPQALQSVFAAPWEITITPLDTCGKVVLDGELYRQLTAAGDDWIDMLMVNYREWLPQASWMDPATNPDTTSSILFDTVAVYLAVEERLLEIEELPLRVTNDGYTVIDEANGRPVRVAIRWRDMNMFKRGLVSTLLR